jgi:hypothetical protein
MDSRLSQQLATIRTAEALAEATNARAIRAGRHRRGPSLTLPRSKAMIAMWRAGSRAR